MSGDACLPVNGTRMLHAQSSCWHITISVRHSMSKSRSLFQKFAVARLRISHQVVGRSVNSFQIRARSCCGRWVLKVLPKTKGFDFTPEMHVAFNTLHVAGASPPSPPLPPRTHPRHPLHALCPTPPHRDHVRTRLRKFSAHNVPSTLSDESDTSPPGKQFNTWLLEPCIACNADQQIKFSKSFCLVLL